MPLFDMKCGNCGLVENDVLLTRYDSPHVCRCGTKMSRVPGAVVPRCFPSDGVFLEHVSPTGETFHNRREIKEFERKHDIYIDMAHD
jgi:hypothetical protein